jgi:hypothetical protein
MVPEFGSSMASGILRLTKFNAPSFAGQSVYNFFQNTRRARCVCCTGCTYIHDVLLATVNQQSRLLRPMLRESRINIKDTRPFKPINA